MGQPVAPYGEPHSILRASPHNLDVGMPSSTAILRHHSQVSKVWAGFQTGFIELWSDETLHKGQDYLRAIYPDSDGLKGAQARYMRRVWQVTIGALGNRFARTHDCPRPCSTSDSLQGEVHVR